MQAPVVDHPEATVRCVEEASGSPRFILTPQSGVADTLQIERYFTEARDGLQSIFENVEWNRRDVAIKDGQTGEVVFEQRDVHAPAAWSDDAVRIVASKYFRGQGDERENSVDTLIYRVVKSIQEAGVVQGYLPPGDTAFAAELGYLLVHQMAAFNSPVWFNVGTMEYPNCSACYINTVDDSMESIMDLMRTEARLFKGGSGSGVNISSLRPKNAPLSGSGKASGPVSFMAALDASAGVIKSGGKCLAPTQKVFTERGPREVRELADAGKDFIVLSYDPPSKRYKAKKARAWLSGRKEVLRVTTDKGTFETSADHPYRLSDGRARRAHDLEPGNSLFPATAKTSQEYVRVGLHDGKKGKERWHRMIARDVAGWDIEGMSVHHRDGDKLNNSIENLEVLHASEHAMLHGLETAAAGEHIFQRKYFGKVGSANGMHGDSQFWSNEEKVAAYKAKQGNILRERGDARKMQNDAARQKMLNTAFRILNEGHSIESFDLYIEGRKAVIGPIGSVSKVRQSIEKRFGSYDAFRNEVAANNHRVVSIESLGEMDVYSVEVDCPTADDKTAASGHTYVIWDGDEHTGTGVSVFNTRRAAKIVIMNSDHPDVLEFIECKAEEEKKAHTLIGAGYPADFNGPAYSSLRFQNANHSVRVMDGFMVDYVAGNDQDIRARRVMRAMAEAAHVCGDPGIQYDDTINRWNPVLDIERINGSNPCSEYLFVDDSACNLASINLMAFRRNDGSFHVVAFQHAVRTLITAMEILVDMAGYPTETIARNSHAYRPLGLGFTNLGAYLMSVGLAYDSDEGRDFAGSVTALMGAEAYLQSARLAEVAGPFARFPECVDSFQRVMKQHYDASRRLAKNLVSVAAVDTWRSVVAVIEDGGVGFRNAQTTVLAPTGTISFMMDCDTTGIEPEIGLIRHKALAGGGHMTLVNRTVPMALHALDYGGDEIEEDLLPKVTAGDLVGFRAGLVDRDQDVFDTSFADATGRSISWEGHLKMMAACQPFLAGGISKTVNMPGTATVEDIEQVYKMGWELGLKSVAIYRDGSKGAQVLTTARRDAAPAVVPVRTRLPDTRWAINHKFRVGNVEGYISLGFYENGRPGEIFITASKAGSTISGLLNTVATLTSIALQYGVPVEILAQKFSHVRFEPSGFTDNNEIPSARSIIDYVFRWLGTQTAVEVRPVSSGTAVELMVPAHDEGDGDACPVCGTMMARSGSCQTCPSCGHSGGCG